MGSAVLCGDGYVTGLEDCDDGNAIGGDGCSSYCQVGSCACCLPSEVACLDPRQWLICVMSPRPRQVESGYACTGSGLYASICFTGVQTVLDTFEVPTAVSKLYTVTLSSFGSWVVGPSFARSGGNGLQIVTNEVLAGANFMTFGQRTLGLLTDKSLLRLSVNIRAASSGSTIPLFFLFVPYPSTSLTPVRFKGNT